MSSMARAVLSQESWIDELCTPIIQLKKEIHSTFARLKASLKCKEIQLLDQVDCISKGIPAVIIKQQMHLMDVKGMLYESMKLMQFSKDFNHMDGVNRASNVLGQLHDEVRDSVRLHSFYPSSMEQDRYPGGFSSLGRLEAHSVSDDADSDSTENSWDVVDEKSGLESDDRCDKVRCHSGENHLCRKKGVTEIEDIDFAAVLCGDVENTEYTKGLKNVCKANELCTAIHECVCETPCLVVVSKQKPENSGVDAGIDPVSQLSMTLESLFSSCPEKESSRIVDAQDPDDGETALLLSDRHDEEAILRISKAILHTINTPIEGQKSDDTLINATSFSSHCEFTDNLRLRNALESEKLTPTEKPDPIDRAAHRNMSWVESRNRARGKCCDAVISSDQSSGRIFQCDTGAAIKDGQQGPPQGDPVVSLSSQLQKIFEGNAS